MNLFNEMRNANGETIKRKLSSNKIEIKDSNRDFYFKMFGYATFDHIEDANLRYYNIANVLVNIVEDNKKKNRKKILKLYLEKIEKDYKNQKFKIIFKNILNKRGYLLNEED